ncbi:T9SS type A sorting domain-containing protein [Empedobacter brevis]|uniref:T9SS type A sorting domain-containing protein n=1 Tax=Empedobacter brevis TaxID=247 RepID=UPI00289BCA97|nr:T9SS type A sorting domain-containing protein [Empedobacter brevis]
MKKNYFGLLSASVLAITIYSHQVNAQVYIIGERGGENATGVSNDGNIVALQTPNANFIWTKEEGTKVLNSMPEGVYNSGKPMISKDGTKIAATGTNPSTGLLEMASYDVKTKQWNYLGTLGSSMDGVASSAWGMTPDGKTIVGLGLAPNNGAHGIYWTQEKGLIDIGTSVTGKYSRIDDVSDDGRIFVGYQDNTVGNRQAAYWEDGKQTVVPTANGENISSFTSVSGNGKWMLGSSGSTATKWHKEEGLIKITHPKAGMFFKGASTATNYDGSVVIGYYRAFPGLALMGEGFIWTEKTGRIELNEYVKSLGYDDLGIKFSLPLAISENGKHIVGSGRIEALAQYVSFLITLPDTLGTTEATSKVEFDIYPNPATDFVNIKTNGKLESSIIYNMSGQVVLKSVDKKLNITKLPKGVYVLKIVIDDKETTTKIIKN